MIPGSNPGAPATLSHKYGSVFNLWRGGLTCPRNPAKFRPLRLCSKRQRRFFLSSSRAPDLEYLLGCIWGSTFSRRLSESIAHERAQTWLYRSNPSSLRCAAHSVGSLSDSRISPGAPGVGATGAATLLQRYGSLEAALAAGRFPAMADCLRLYRSIATMNKRAPLPSLRNQTPTWQKAAALAREWELNQLAGRLEELAVG